MLSKRNPEKGGFTFLSHKPSSCFRSKENMNQENQPWVKLSDATKSAPIGHEICGLLHGGQSSHYG
jgi:hypothetical protein